MPKASEKGSQKGSRKARRQQHSHINSILAACDGGTRCLEDWVGNSSESDKIDRGGRGLGTPAQQALQLESRVAGRLDHRKWPRTAPYRRRCAAGSAARWWKTSVTPDKLALLAAVLDIDGTASQESVDASNLAQLTALRARLRRGRRRRRRRRHGATSASNPPPF